MSVSFIAELSPVYCCLVLEHFKLQQNKHTHKLSDDGDEDRLFVRVNMRHWNKTLWPGSKVHIKWTKRMYWFYCQSTPMNLFCLARNNIGFVQFEWDRFLAYFTHHTWWTRKTTLVWDSESTEQCGPNYIGNFSEKFMKFVIEKSQGWQVHITLGFIHFLFTQPLSNKMD